MEEWTGTRTVVADGDQPTLEDIFDGCEEAKEFSIRFARDIETHLLYHIFDTFPPSWPSANKPESFDYNRIFNTSRLVY